MLSFRQACRSTRRLHSLIHDLGMSLGLNDRLLHQHFATNRAVLSFRQTRLSTRRLHSLVDNLGMPLGRNNFLLHQHRTTNRAVLPFCQPRLSTRRCHGLVHDLGMSLGRNNFLLHQHFATNRAMLSFRQARLGARRLHSLVHDLGVGDGCVPRGELRVGGDSGIVAAPPGQFIVMRLVRRFYRVRRHSRSTIANRLPRENGAVLIPERHLEEGILHLAGRSAHVQRDGLAVSTDS